MTVGGNRTLSGRGAERPDGGDSTRDRLIDAAADLFAERGYERTGIQDIARRAGLTSGAIYSNFRGKRELLLAAMGVPAEAMGRAVGAAREAGTSAIDLIGMGAHALVAGRGGRARPILVNALVLASRDQEVGKSLRKGLARSFRALATLVDEGKAEGSIAGDVDADTFAYYSYALTFGMYLLELAGMAPPDEARWDALLQRLLAALVGSGADGRRSGDGSRAASAGAPRRRRS